MAKEGGSDEMDDMVCSGFRKHSEMPADGDKVLNPNEQRAFVSFVADSYKRRSNCGLVAETYPTSVLGICG